MREQDRRDYSSNIEEDLCRQKDAGEMHAELHLLGREAVEEPGDELRGEDLGDYGAGYEHGGHYSNDDVESFLRVVLALFRKKPCIDGDECDGGGAAGDDVVEPVGQGEGGYVGVGLLSGTKGVGDVGLADVSDDAREGDGRHQQQRRRKGGMLVRWTEEAEETHRLQINASVGGGGELSAGWCRERQLWALRQGLGIFLVGVSTPLARNGP